MKTKNYRTNVSLVLYLGVLSACMSSVCISYILFTPYLVLLHVYRIAGKFGKFGKSSVIRQTKTIQLAELLIRQTFFCQMLEKNQFAKLSRYTVCYILYIFGSHDECTGL